MASDNLIKEIEHTNKKKAHFTALTLRIARCDAEIGRRRNGCGVPQKDSKSRATIELREKCG